MGEKCWKLNICVQSSNRKKKKYVTAINDVSFTLNEGEIVGLVGRSGCGKSVTSFPSCDFWAIRRAGSHRGKYYSRGRMYFHSAISR